MKTWLGRNTADERWIFSRTCGKYRRCKQRILANYRFLFWSL